jgi:hypothetical protein
LDASRRMTAGTFPYSISMRYKHSTCRFNLPKSNDLPACTRFPADGKATESDRWLKYVLSGYSSSWISDIEASVRTRKAQNVPSVHEIDDVWKLVFLKLRRLVPESPLRWPGIYSRPVHVGFLVGRVALGWVLSKHFGLLYQFWLHQLFHININRAFMDTV